jgi:hypothetical protein
MVLVADPNQEADSSPACIQGALGAGQAGVDRRVQGRMVVLGEEGQAGHGTVLVGFGDGEGDRPFGQGTHLVDPALLRAEDFQGFFAARQTALLGRIEQVTGKRIDPGVAVEPEDEPAEYEVIEGYDDLEGDGEDQPISIAEQLGELPIGDKL